MKGMRILYLAQTNEAYGFSNHLEWLESEGCKVSTVTVMNTGPIVDFEIEGIDVGADIDVIIVNALTENRFVSTINSLNKPVLYCVGFYSPEGINLEKVKVSYGTLGLGKMADYLAKLIS